MKLPIKFECFLCLPSQQQQQHAKSITLHHCPRHMCISLQPGKNSTKWLFVFGYDRFVNTPKIVLLFERDNITSFQRD